MLALSLSAAPAARDRFDCMNETPGMPSLRGMPTMPCQCVRVSAVSSATVVSSSTSTPSKRDNAARVAALGELVGGAVQHDFEHCDASGGIKSECSSRCVRARELIRVEFTKHPCISQAPCKFTHNMPHNCGPNDCNKCNNRMCKQ